MSSTRTSTNPVVRVGLQVMAFGVAAAFVLLFAVDPHSVGANASQGFAPTVIASAGGEQSLSVAGGAASAVTRDGYTVKEPPAPEPVAVPVALPAVTTDEPAAAAAGGGCETNVVPTPGPPAPGSLQDIAYQAVMGYGWGEQNYYYLLALWNRESGWNPTASNPSGAYGIPQALPGSKMGPGWESDPNVQINWGLQYIAGSYGTPCEAWASSENRGWY
ncbi:aggregation-promoting factor C-terminal-like domain-containing protein [Herbiconiux daphne]|uniref:Lytic transglycosylase domain-containing protein n=1 Tax=Herbiconiux daphne TaxID=2970914 RepID=A0ABT2GYK0_9MICO|nr:transglycosylase SLT domain-containing protein [Herbiconiux daphne]MCS5733038.1 lytic transglycosylase domain-containing protein [Herbiconiux daphne]